MKKRTLNLFIFAMLFNISLICFAQKEDQSQIDWRTTELPQKSPERKLKSVPDTYIKTQKNASILEMTAISEDAKTSFAGSFTLEFDFLANELPMDEYYEGKGLENIEIFEAFDADKKTILSLYLNKYNRLTLAWRDRAGKKYSILSTWNIKENYEVVGILRGKWYKVGILRSLPQNTMNLYLDGALVGSKKFTGDLAEVQTLQLGACFNKSASRSFNGKINLPRISKEELYNADSSKEELAKARERLNLAAQKECMEFLLPENPVWAKNHPRLLLTPSRVQVLKEQLKLGDGPELMRRLMEKCEAMIDPKSPEYFDELPLCANFQLTIKPAVLCLGAQLSGEKRFAEHAGKLVVDFVDKHGYHDFAHQQVQSVLMAKPMLSIAYTYDWAYEYLTVEQRRKIRLFLLETAKAVYDYYKGNISSSSAKRDAMRGWVANWTALSISTMGNASLAILGETSGRVLTWLDYATFRASQYGLFAIGMNGCFHEMPAYMAYGAGPLMLFMEGLYTAGGDDLLKVTNFSKFTDFLAYIIYPSNSRMMPLKYSREINGFHQNETYLMALLRNKMNTPSAEWCWQKLYGKNPWSDSTLFNIIWFNPETEKLNSPNLPLAKWFKSEGVAAFRTSWNDKDAIAGIIMAYKAKIMAHDQSDRGQFTLCGFQGNWIVDNGGREKPEFAYRSAHNLITIDNQDSFKPVVLRNHHHDSFISGFCHLDGAGTVIEADLSDSYRYIYNWQRLPVSSSGKSGEKDDFRKAERKLMLVREKSAPAYLLVYDKIQKDDADHSYTLNLHSAPENDVKIKDAKVEFHKYPQSSCEVSNIYKPLKKNERRVINHSGAPKGGYAKYIIDVPADGEYNLYGYGRPGEKNPGGMDSFWVDFGGKKMNWGVTRYSWTQINKEPLNLKKGPNTLTLLTREPESRAAKFALFQNSKENIPLFNKPAQNGLIIVDAGNPVEKGNVFCIEKEKVDSESPEAFMTMLPLSPQNGEIKKDVFPGAPLSHYRITVTSSGKEAVFLNVFYPHKKGMEVPDVKNRADNVFEIEWKECKDTISYKKGNELVFGDIETDADLLFIRMKEKDLFAFAIVNGTYLKYKGDNLIKLHGSNGLALWNDSSLAITGKNVYNFDFKFPNNRGSLTKVKAQSKTIEIKKTGETWQASMPFAGENILTW